MSFVFYFADGVLLLMMKFSAASVVRDVAGINIS
jgi:hypothetical protein